MKKTKRRPNWGEEWGRNRRYTMVDLRLQTWFSRTPQSAAFAGERGNLGMEYDRRDANRMFKWMARGTRMLEVVRAQLAREGAGA